MHEYTAAHTALGHTLNLELSTSNYRPSPTTTHRDTFTNFEGDWLRCSQKFSAHAAIRLVESGKIDRASYADTHREGGDAEFLVMAASFYTAGQ